MQWSLIMKISKKFISLSLLALFHVTQLSASEWNVEVNDSDVAYFTTGLTVHTLNKWGTGQLNITGGVYDMDFIDVKEGTVYVNGVSENYIYLIQPITLTAGEKYPVRKAILNVRVDTGETGYDSGSITSAVVRKIGGGVAVFEGAGCEVGYLAVLDGVAVLNAAYLIPDISAQLGASIQANSDISLPNVTMTADGSISSYLIPEEYLVTIKDLVLAGFTLTTANKKTIVTMLDTSASGGTISNTDQVVLNGAKGSNLLTKLDSGLMTAEQDLSDASMPIDVLKGILQVIGLGKLPTGDIKIDNALGHESVFKLSASNVAGIPLAGAVPGLMEIKSGCTLEVDADLSVPSASSVNDVFTGGLKMNGGSTLKLGNGVNFDRDIVVGTVVPHI